MSCYQIDWQIIQRTNASTHLHVPLQVIGKKLGMKIEPKPLKPNPRFQKE